MKKQLRENNRYRREVKTIQETYNTYLSGRKLKQWNRRNAKNDKSGKVKIKSIHFKMGYHASGKVDPG